MNEVTMPRSGPVAREIYAALRQRIMAAQLMPGTAISEVQFSEQLGVSRTPVREVFRRLADEGLLRIVPQVGTFVAPIQLRAVYDSQFVRETLECRTIVLAAGNMSIQAADDLQDFLTLQKRAIRDNDLEKFFDADDRMHTYLIGLGGYPAIWELIQGVKAQLDRVRYLSLESGDWLNRIFDQHEMIVSRVIEADTTGAEAAMREHLQSVFLTIEKLAENRPELFEGNMGTSTTPISTS
ncbi:MULTISPECIES: GntR family transcriptional regulator [unclassified Rhizobium]|uniref:GntR family transcriptional regulator n=1 Tax=unclassified Rhizobium TaxID=2613769 RepID=UPI001ADA2356|nr:MULTISPECIES: GntR family transcriptional regulator [unclassified Rhizobium]MBO9123723.1 GntR family transcriptional regulator [Rhizobium sp. 16-488-2b]MBO9174255.1 GntR family transcriptional regulator [Rhizobium sp. 16-488-2a]